jgi:hypothetical protein
MVGEETGSVNDPWRSGAARATIAGMPEQRALPSLAGDGVRDDTSAIQARLSSGFRLRRGTTSSAGP